MIKTQINYYVKNVIRNLLKSEIYNIQDMIKEITKLWLKMNYCSYQQWINDTYSTYIVIVFYVTSINI